MRHRDYPRRVLLGWRWHGARSACSGLRPDSGRDLHCRLCVAFLEWRERELGRDQRTGLRAHFARRRTGRHGFHRCFGARHRSNHVDHAAKQAGRHRKAGLDIRWFRTAAPRGCGSEAHVCPLLSLLFQPRYRCLSRNGIPFGGDHLGIERGALLFLEYYLPAGAALAAETFP